MELETLRDLYVDELKDLYSAESQLVKALPKLAKAATSSPLKAAFNEHLAQTKIHVSRLEEILHALGEAPKGKTCKAMKGLVEEGSEMVKEDAEPEVRDAGLISAAQRVEHYEMAGYGCVRTYAQLLGDKKAATLLQRTLDEEGAADKKLTQLAERINVVAESPAKRAQSAKAPAPKRRPVKQLCSRTAGKRNNGARA